MKISEILTKRKRTIEEIAVRNDLPFLQVLEIYTKFSAKVYFRNKNKMALYDSKLEKEIFKLTERYFDIYKIKKLKENKFL